MSYKEGIVAAIMELKEHTGSSMVKIKKVMEAKLPKDKTWKNHMFLTALKAGIASGEVVQNKVSIKKTILKEFICKLIHNRSLKPRSLILHIPFLT